MNLSITVIFLLIDAHLLIKSNISNQFLQDTLDTLFGILDESSQRYALKVFDCLVSTDKYAQ